MCYNYYFATSHEHQTRSLYLGNCIHQILAFLVKPLNHMVPSTISNLPNEEINFLPRLLKDFYSWLLHIPCGSSLNLHTDRTIYHVWGCGGRWNNSFPAFTSHLHFPRNFCSVKGPQWNMRNVQDKLHRSKMMNNYENRLKFHHSTDPRERERSRWNFNQQDLGCLPNGMSFVKVNGPRRDEKEDLSPHSPISFFL